MGQIESIIPNPYALRLKETKCSLCRKEKNNERNIWFPCNHQFCNECFYKWVDQQKGSGNKKCPMCNFEFCQNVLNIYIKQNPRAETAHSHTSESSEAVETEVVPLPFMEIRLPLNMNENNSFRTRNGRIVINDVECEDGIYRQDGLKITIQNGIYTSIDEKGRETCFGNITGVFYKKYDN